MLAPGVPLTHPTPHWTVSLAQAAGVEIIGDIELFGREREKTAPGAPFVAITGTNGKSTTTALTAHLFRCFGHEVAMGGNIGTPILQLPPPSPDRVHVVECSSFQIDLSPTLHPSVGMLMNLTPDHLDRHGTMAAYAAIKARLVAGADRAIVSVDDPDCRAIALHLAGQGHEVATISVAGHPVENGITLDGTRLRRHCAGSTTAVADLDGIASLRGAHNAQNAAAAILALGDEAEDLDRLQAALRSFPGLAHRMEQVGRTDGVLFINDSKATNADAAEKALLAFPRVHWIIGGRAKEGGIEPLRPLFDRVVKAYCIGEAGPAFASTLHDVGRCPSRCAARSTSRPRPPRPTPAPRTRCLGASTRSSCCRPPAPPTTNTPTSRSAATRFASWPRASCSRGRGAVLPSAACGRRRCARDDVPVKAWLIKFPAMIPRRSAGPSRR